MPIKITKKPSNKEKTFLKSEPEIPKEGLAGPVTLLVDKITLTAKVPFKSLAEIHHAFAGMQQSTDLLKAAKSSATYDVVNLISLGKETAHISFDPKKSYFPDLRLEFNPAKLGPSGMKALYDVLQQLLPMGGWDFLVENGRVSRLDVAADIHGARMHHFHLLPQQVLVTKTYEIKAKLKSIYVGKPKGNQLTVYSKSAEMAARGKPLEGPVIRIEKRLKKVGVPLSILAELKNPLFGFSIVSTPPGPPPSEKDYVWTLFLDSVARRTLGPALKLLPPPKMTIYRKHFEAHAQPFWDADQVWTHWPDTLKEMRLVHVKDWPG